MNDCYIQWCCDNTTRWSVLIFGLLTTLLFLYFIMFCYYNLVVILQGMLWCAAQISFSGTKYSFCQIFGETFIDGLCLSLFLWLQEHNLNSYAFSPGKDCIQWLVNLGVQRCDPFTSNRITLRDHSNFTAPSEISWGSLQPPSRERGKPDILRTVRHRLWISIALWKLETPLHPPSTRVLGFPCGSADKEFTCNVGRPGFNPWVGKTPWIKERLPTPVFWPGEFHGLYSPLHRKESDTTEWLSLSTEGILAQVWFTVGPLGLQIKPGVRGSGLKV